MDMVRKARLKRGDPDQARKLRAAFQEAGAEATELHNQLSSGSFEVESGVRIIASKRAGSESELADVS